MNLYSSKEMTDTHTHRRTHTQDKRNKNSRKKKEKRINDQYSDLKIGLKWFCRYCRNYAVFTVYNVSLHTLSIVTQTSHTDKYTRQHVRRRPSTERVSARYSSIEPTVCAAHVHWICSGQVFAASCRTKHFHCDVCDSGLSVQQVSQLVQRQLGADCLPVQARMPSFAVVVCTYADLVHRPDSQRP